MTPAPLRIGVLVMAYGTPSSPDEVEAFYTDVRRGRPPSAEQLAELIGRYAAIGGVSPLSRNTAGQVAEIQRQLELRWPGRYLCCLGNKHSEPRIEDAVGNLAGQGVRELVGLVLAPHYSRGSVGEYVSRASGRATELGMSAAFVEHWHEHPALIELLAERVDRALRVTRTCRGRRPVERRAPSSRHGPQPPAPRRRRRRPVRRRAPPQR